MDERRSLSWITVALIGALASASSCDRWNPFTIAGRPTVPAFRVTCDRSYETTSAPLGVTFDASGSMPGEGSGADLFYEWNFRDGTENEKKKVATATTHHDFPKKNRYRVSVTVQDRNLARAESDLQEIHVGNKRPIAALTVSPAAPVEGQPVTITGSDFSDSDGTLVQYIFNPDDHDQDGPVQFSATDCRALPSPHTGDRRPQPGRSLDWTFERAGTYTVTLSVVDNDGEASAVRAEKQVRVVRGPIAVRVTSHDDGGPPITGRTVFRASTDGAVRVVDFFLDGYLAGSATSVPFDVEWDSTGKLPDGGYDLRARAYDQANNQAQSRPIRVEIKNNQ